MRVVVALVSAVWLIATCQVGAVVLESKLPPAFFLRTDHMGDGVILHDSAPSMSWRVSHFSPGEHQTAFQVVVINNANDLVMWGESLRFHSALRVLLPHTHTQRVGY